MTGAKYDDRRIAGQSVDSDVDDGGCVPGKRGNEDSSSTVEVSCSICLELVVDDGTRSRAKLQCGHHFHLDCIGSAFNMKGTMQCPNCRNVEKGQWLYSNGSTRPVTEFVMEDWVPEEDLYGLSYPEMQYRVHWCPFGELPQAGSFEELEPTYHNEFHGHHAAAVNHSYLAYVGPGPAATPRISDNSNNADDHPWNSHSNDHFHQLSVAPQYHHHHHHSTSFSLPGTHLIDGENDSSAAQGLSHPHPFLFSYRSNPAINTHQGSNTQMREHLHTQHHVYNNNQRQHYVNGPNLASTLVSVTRRGLQPPPMPDQSVGFFIYPTPSSSSESDQFHGWEREWFPHFPVPWNHRTISSFWHRHL